MKKLLILGEEANSHNANYVCDFLADAKNIGFISAGTLNDTASTLAHAASLFNTGTKRNLLAIDANNLTQLDAVYIHEGNPYLIMGWLKETNLLISLCELINTGLPVIAAGSSALVLAESLRTALSMPLSTNADVSALAILPVHLQTGELDAAKRSAFREFFAIYPDRSVLFIPKDSALSIRGSMALVQGESGIIKLVGDNEHFYKSKDYICL